MKLFRKLRRRIETLREFRWRKSRKIGILVERKETKRNNDNTDKPIGKEEIKKIPCENFENNIIYIWKCDRNENRVRLMKFRRNFSLKRCSRMTKINRSSTHTDDRPDHKHSYRRIYYGNHTSGRNGTFNSVKSRYSTIKSRSTSSNRKLTMNEIKKEESRDQNYSAKENLSDLSLPRSRSDEMYNKSEQTEQNAKKNNSEIFIKYIPVDSNYQLIRKFNHDETIESSWVEIQAWCSKYQTKREQSVQSTPKAQNSHILLINNKEKSRFSIYDEDVDTETCDRSIVCDDEIVRHPRFGYFSNQEYFKAIDLNKQDETKKNRIQFCITPETLSSSVQLCHQKTEIILTCLRSYFKHFADVEVMWVDELEKHLPRKPIKSCFPLTVADIVEETLLHARAVMYITKDVSVILRHPDTCFLQTLAFSAGLKRNELTILPFELKPCHYSIVKHI